MEKKIYLLGIIVLSVAVFFCPGFLPPSYADRSEDLYPLAKKEGTVTYGGSLEEKLVKSSLEAFEAKYPGVKVKYVRKSSGPFMTLIETERQARRVSFDLIRGTEPIDIVTLKLEGYFMKYKHENWDMIPDKLKDKEGYFVAHSVSAMLGAYNPKFISAAEAPKSYKDIINPKWKNKISNSSPSRGGTGLASVVRILNLYGWDFVKNLADNGAMCVEGHGSVVRMLISGERPLGWEISAYRAIEEETKGSPFKIIWFSEGVPAYMGYMGIPQAAPHPNAGKLLANFMMSREGQALLAKESNQWSPLAGIDPPPLCKPLDQTNLWYPDMDYLLKSGKEVAERFDKIFGLR